jgi:hypothetical protein
VLAQVGRALAPRPVAAPWTSALRRTIRAWADTLPALRRARVAARARCAGLA